MGSVCTGTLMPESSLLQGFSGGQHGGVEGQEVRWASSRDARILALELGFSAR